MIQRVAEALGEDLREQVVFVGGCTTGLLLSDEVTKEEVRYTDDVDLIIDVLGYADWNNFQSKLKEKGFEVSMGDEVICRMRLGELKVDFMPSDENILGFSNRWYSHAIDTASKYKLSDQISIKLISPPYFVATKLEAYNGRGNNDPLGSHDIEDILNIVDGREELIAEIYAESKELKEYISDQISSLLENPGFEHAVQGASRVPGREEVIFERFEALRDMRNL
jgi:predicted nucleotidyltransferase